METIVTSIAVLLRILSNPLGNVYQKHLTANGFHPLIVNFITYALLSLGCIFIGFMIEWPILTFQYWLFSLLGGMAGALGNGFLVKALQKGDLSILGPINSYKAVVGIIFGIFLLGEFPNIWGILGIVLIIYGSYFVLDTMDEGFSWSLLKRREIQFRIWAMILTAVEAVFIKKVILESSVTIAFISWCVFGALFSFILLFLYGLNLKRGAVQIETAHLMQFVLLVLSIGIMQYTTNYTFDHLPVGYALSLFQLSIIVSVLLGHKIFKEKDLRKKLIGTVIMIVGSVLVILLKGR